MDVARLRAQISGMRTHPGGARAWPRLAPRRDPSGPGFQPWGPPKPPGGIRRSHFATMLSSKLKAIQLDGKELYEVPIAVTGSWVKHGHHFAISRADLEAMVENFRKRKNDQLVIDYEHASEQPEVARGGPIPAAGWIHDLRTGLSFPHGHATNGDRAVELRALIEWTPKARRLIQEGAYRFFSPAIDWSFRDKETGKPQGATLTSGALTNHPFLEELPPIMLTDFGVAESHASLADVSNAQLDQPLKSVSVGYGPPPGGHRPQGGPQPQGSGPQGGPQGGSKVKRLTVRKLTDGPVAGNHGVFDGDDAVGYVDNDDFRDYVKQRLDQGDFDDLIDNDDFSETTGGRAATLFAERLGMPGASLDEIKERLAAAAPEAGSAEQASRALLLREAVKGGVINHARASELARDNRITLADYIAAQEAEKKMDEAVRAGKILPRDRQFFFLDALERPREFAAYVRQAAPVVRLGSAGIGAGGGSSVDEEVEQRTQQLMREDSVSYAKALKKVLASDKELERRYRSAHRRELNSAAAPGANGLGAAGITQ